MKGKQEKSLTDRKDSDEVREKAQKILASSIWSAKFSPVSGYLAKSGYPSLHMKVESVT